MENTPAIKHAQPKGKKPVLLIVLAIVAAVLIAGACVWFFWLRGYLAASKAAPVYVTSVASIVGACSDTDPRYSGLVEPQEITKINKDDTRTVADVMVKEGDDVQVGTPCSVMTQRRFSCPSARRSWSWRALPTKSPL